MRLELLVLLLVLWLLARAIARRKRRAFSFDNTVVVITGAASGIGRALAHKVFQEALDVTLVLLDIDTKALVSLQATLLESQDATGAKRVRIYECNKKNEIGSNGVADGVNRTVDVTVARILDDVAPKHIGVLINNADLKPEQIRKTFAVNTFAHFWMVQATLPSLQKASKALIVTMSSVMGMTSSAGLTDYCASKAAVNAFHEALRLELWRDNVNSIQTLLVCPAGVNTNMFAGILQADDWAVQIARYCIPQLEETDVATLIYRSMCRGDELLVSCFSGWRGVAFSWAPLLARMLPVSLYDIVIRFGGGLHGMDTFVGKGETREDTIIE
ncbi:hypothetical protein CCR75_007264 [Bremia lactucae]|uniref:Ketoreductase domain-containing protein n=1 Tax=Bremia lactucae TaxID=4779 RepID=A0A976IGH0_BRELC|nr:hypothetical protein CCR75_007264 [Bremia lactucae]